MATSDERRRVSRRSFLRGLAVTGGAMIGAATLAACGGSTPAASPTTAPAAGTEGEPVPTTAPAAAGGEAVQLELWTFADTHARWFESMATDFKKENPGFDLKVTQIAYEDMHDKLLVALQSGGAGAPDLVDIEQGRFGGFLASEDTGLVDLSDRLKEYDGQLVAGRQALYSYQGKTYGIEHALTPVVLYYRSDIWEEAGADPANFKTWDDYIAGGKRVAQGDTKAINFPAHELLLRQRGADYYDADGEVTLDSDLSIETMNWILDLRDEHKIAQQDPGDDAWWAAVKAGTYVSAVGADWYGGFFKDYVPDLKGKWKAMPLPAFTADGLRTSCHGGTGNCIVSFSKNVEMAWKYQQFSMLSVEGNVRRFELTNLFPPFIPAQSDARMHKPDEYFSNQDLGQLFADLAPNVPAQYQSPSRAEMGSKLTPLWQDIYDRKLAPADAFKQVADEIRQTMQSS